MRLAIFALAPFLLVAASEPAPPTALDMPSYEQPAREWKTLEDVPPSPEECRDRIHHASDEVGQPRIERQPADPDEPLMIWAVDRRQDGCSVLVMAGNQDDIRPLPAPAAEGPLMPAR